MNTREPARQTDRLICEQSPLRWRKRISVVVDIRHDSTISTISNNTTSFSFIKLRGVAIVSHASICTAYYAAKDCLCDREKVRERLFRRKAVTAVHRWVSLCNAQCVGVSFSIPCLVFASTCIVSASLLHCLCHKPSDNWMSPLLVYNLKIMSIPPIEFHLAVSLAVVHRLNGTNKHMCEHCAMTRRVAPGSLAEAYRYKWHKWVEIVQTHRSRVIKVLIAIKLFSNVS